MITEAILSLIMLAVQTIMTGFGVLFSLLPSQVDSAFATIGPYFAKANAILPIDTMMTIIGLTLSIEIAILYFKMSNWVLNKLRGAG